MAWLLQEALYNSASGDLFDMKLIEDIEQKLAGKLFGHKAGFT